MDIGKILLLAIGLVVAWFLWQRFVVPALKPPLDFLVWLVPALIALAVIFWILSQIFGVDILHVKIFYLFLPPLRWLDALRRWLLSIARRAVYAVWVRQKPPAPRLSVARFGLWLNRLG